MLPILSRHLQYFPLDLMLPILSRHLQCLPSRCDDSYTIQTSLILSSRFDASNTIYTSLMHPSRFDASNTINVFSAALTCNVPILISKRQCCPQDVMIRLLPSLQCCPLDLMLLPIRQSLSTAQRVYLCCLLCVWQWHCMGNIKHHSRYQNTNHRPTASPSLGI